MLLMMMVLSSGRQALAQKSATSAAFLAVSTIKSSSFSSSARLATAAASVSSSSSSLSFKTHEEFVQALKGLDDDPLAASGTNIVVYRGNPKAKIMVVGEAPGETEDRLGKPFVGKAGQLLDQILTSVNLDVDKDVYVCNIVRRRPPQNRNPLAGEVAYFKPWLLEEIRLVDPYIILLAGSFSMKAVLGDPGRGAPKLPGITKLRGQFVEKSIGGEGGLDGQGNRLCMPIFHPSYLLRNPSRTEGGPKWLMWQDIKMVRQTYDTLLMEKGIAVAVAQAKEKASEGT